MNAGDMIYPEHHRKDIEHLMKRGSGLSSWTLAWNDVTTFKPIAPQDNYQPCHHPLPGLVRSVGANRFASFFLRPSDWHTLDCGDAPYPYLRRRLLELTESGEKDYQQLFEHHGMGPVLPAAGDWSAVQGTLYFRGNHDFTNKPRMRVVLLLSPSATQATLTLLADRRWREDLLDPTSPTMLEWYQATWNYQVGARWRLLYQAEAPPKVGPSDYGAGRFYARMVVPMSPKVTQVPPASPVKQTFVPWEDVFRQLTVVEQLRLLADVLGSELVITAYQGSQYEDLLPAWVKVKMK